MPVTFLQCPVPGVDKVTLAEGAGGAGPRLTNATCWRINSIHIDFDSAMLVRLPEGLVGENSSYKIYEKANPAVVLPVMRVITDRKYPTLAEVFVHGMVHNTEYTFEVIADVLDEYGTPIDHDYATFDFIGQGHQVPSPGGLSMFIGLDAGVQRLTETDWRPDLEPPYLENPDPPPGTVNVPTDYVPSFDLKDDDTGVRLAGTRIWVDTVLVFQGGISYAGYTVVVTPIAGGYHYELTHPSIELPGNTTITLRVYAEDLAYIPNTLDTYWNFTTRVWPPPYVTDKNPAANAEDVKKDAHIEFTIMDDFKQVARSSIQVWVRGELVFNAGSFLRGWSGSRFGATGLGFWFDIVPDPVNRWVAEERIIVRAKARNVELKQMDESWHFTVKARPFSFRIYPMIFDGVRKADEGED